MNSEQRQESEVLSQVQTICHICHQVITASYVAEDGKVYLVKECKEHGLFKTLAAPNKDLFVKWTSHPVVNIPPNLPQRPGSDSGEGQCPLNCGMCQDHLQTACCVLIDVTDRCNQTCPYCFASASQDQGNIMSDGLPEPTLEEIKIQYQRLLDLGEEREFNIQISGGEPTVRQDLPEIIALGKSMGFRYIQLNTNGRRIAMEPGYAKTLKKAGTTVVFLQFDGTNDEIYKSLRGEPLWDIKKKVIEECRKASLAVTLVPTLVAGVNDQNIGEMMTYLLENLDIVKGIHFQPVSFFGRYPETDSRITMFDVLHLLEEQTQFFKYDDFCPINTGHPLCCFYSTYTKVGDQVKCGLSKTQAETGVSCCDQGCSGIEVADSCCQDPLDVISKDRDYVLNKWEVATGETCCQGDSPMDFDSFLTYYRQNTFTVTAMAFMDGTNLDSQRLKRCRVVQMTRDGHLIPFCAYNTIYRGRRNE